MKELRFLAGSVARSSLESVDHLFSSPELEVVYAFQVMYVS